jgi:flagellar biosynthesis/type III secretory pathway protein FliH
MVRAAVREALDQVKDSSECHIYLHPDDLRLLEQCNNGPQVSAAGSSAEMNGASLHFHGLEEVTRGGCVVKTRFGTIDVQRGTKLEQLRKTVLS